MAKRRRKHESLTAQKAAELPIMKPDAIGLVGFDSLPDQLVNKCVQYGFVFLLTFFSIFSVLIIIYLRQKLGNDKSTLMDIWFNTRFESIASPHTLPNLKLMTHTYKLQKTSVRLKLTMCDTVGYGDQINKRLFFYSSYIEAQFEAYLQEDLKMERGGFKPA